MCSRVGHVRRECPDKKAKQEILSGAAPKFSSWLRAILERVSGAKQSGSMKGSIKGEAVKERFGECDIEEGSGVAERMISKGRGERIRAEGSPYASSCGEKQGIDTKRGVEGELVVCGGQNGVAVTHVTGEINISQMAHNKEAEDSGVVSANVVYLVRDDTRRKALLDVGETGEEKIRAEPNKTYLSGGQMSGRKLKKATREMILIGKIESPLLKIKVANQGRRRINRGKGVSPIVEGLDKGVINQKETATPKVDGNNVGMVSQVGQKRKKLIFLGEEEMVVRTSNWCCGEGEGADLAEPVVQARQKP